MIEVKNLSVDLGEFVLKDISMNIEEGEYFIILGPTGAGKTVLLESIAGLYPIKSGEIWLREKEITTVEPEKRKISIVYQDHALFPHFSVKDNITFGLKMNKATKDEQEDRLNWVAELLGINNLLQRKPDTLLPPGFSGLGKRWKRFSPHLHLLAAIRRGPGGNLFAMDGFL